MAIAATGHVDCRHSSLSDDGHIRANGRPVLYMITVLFAIAAGSGRCGENRLANHYQFLLHRPLDRSTIFISKIGFGAATVIVVVGLPQLLFAIWADSRIGWRGNMWPFPACQLTAGVLFFYFGAALSGLRPGRWYGSQFLPLLAGILLFIVLQVCANLVASERMPNGGWRTWPSVQWIATIALAPLIEIGFVIAILQVVRTRDYS